MKSQYNTNNTKTYLQYLDPNKFHGWEINQKLPTHGFAWEKKVNDFIPEKTDQPTKKSGEDYILEVDVEYLKVAQEARKAAISSKTK